MAVVPGQSFGNFKVVRLLGEGGFGEVYEAVNPFLQRRAAVKVLHKGLVQDSELVRRFLNEARAASAIRHPNIIEVFDAGLTPTGEPYILMEFLDGSSLQRYLLENGRISLRTAQEIARQAGSALASAHAAGIVHRDLKPENIFLLPDPGTSLNLRVKVLDFGIAKIKHGDDLQSTVKTQAGLLMGSPAYMSPEQCKDSSDVDLRSDIYSLGIIVYEMLTGVPPFACNSAAEMLVMQLSVAPRPLRDHVPQMPEHVEQTVMRALAKEREERYSSVDYFVGALHGTYPALTTQGSTTTSSSSANEAGPPGPSLPAKNGVVDEPASADGPAGRSLASVSTSSALSGSTVTTLTQATGETSSSAGPDDFGDTEVIKHRRWPVALALGVLAVAGAAYFAFRPDSTPTGSSPATPTVPTPALPATPAAPPTVRVHILSSPAGAAVIDAKAGKPMGVTPLEAALPQAKEPLQVTLRLAGYKDKVVRIELDSNFSASVELDEIEPAPVPVAKDKKEGEGKKGGRKVKPPPVDEDEQWRVH
jgi:eukaryotic-like serine/threonine-protein kinase